MDRLREGKLDLTHLSVDEEALLIGVENGANLRPKPQQSSKPRNWCLVLAGSLLVATLFVLTSHCEYFVILSSFPSS